MTSMTIATLHKVRADWLRVQGEVAYLRMLFASSRYLKAIEREQRFNPYHDDARLFTTADNAVPPKVGRERASGHIRVAQAGSSGSRGAPNDTTVILAGRLMFHSSTTVNRSAV
ncbi:MAG: hypothetical protein HOP09_08560 [Hyphomicrobium sp.]|nr:hypothetical protein [Hyphomicrobium sp.]